MALRIWVAMLEGRPKTPEGWLPVFDELDDIIRKMKKSNAGRQIVENRIVDDWERVKRYSDFARLRHHGKVKAGRWKSKPRIGAQSSTIEWTSR